MARGPAAAAPRGQRRSSFVEDVLHCLQRIPPTYSGSGYNGTALPDYARLLLVLAPPMNVATFFLVLLVFIFIHVDFMCTGVLLAVAAAVQGAQVVSKSGNLSLEVADGHDVVLQLGADAPMGMRAILANISAMQVQLRIRKKKKKKKKKGEEGRLEDWAGVVLKRNNRKKTRRR